MSGLVKMASGVCAAVGPYRAVILCMACVAAWGLHAGWVQTLFTADTTGMWAARAGVLWLVLFVAFLPTTRGIDDRVPMGFCMLVMSGLLCLLAFGVVQLIDALHAM